MSEEDVCRLHPFRCDNCSKSMVDDEGEIKMKINGEVSGGFCSDECMIEHTLKLTEINDIKQKIKELCDESERLKTRDNPDNTKEAPPPDLSAYTLQELLEHILSRPEEELKDAKITIKECCSVCNETIIKYESTEWADRKKEEEITPDTLPKTPPIKSLIRID